MFRDDLKSSLKFLATVFIVAALAVLISSLFSNSAQAETFALYGVEYTVKEQEITLSVEDAEALLDDYPEWDTELVKDIQRALKRRDYNLSVDGEFGPKTGMAVKQFQRKKGLTIDGIVGGETIRALGLEDITGEHPRYAPNLRAALNDSPANKLVHLNLNSHLVEAYQLKDDGVHLLRVMLAATGNQKKGYYTNLCNRRLNKTPRPGSRIGNDKENWRGEFQVPITAGDCFHSVLAHRKKGKWILDDNSVLGTNASHGCVRLDVRDAYWLQNFCEKGTAIVVDDRDWDLRCCSK